MRSFITLSLLVLLAPQVHANDSVYIWDDTVGLKSAVQCQVVASTPPSRFKEFADSVIEIAQIPEFPLTRQPVALKGLFLQSVREGDRYGFIHCPNEGGRIYMLFDVFTAEDRSPVAQVGVSPEQASLFASVRQHSAREAEALIEQSFSRNVASMSSLVEGLTVVPGALDNVICTTSSQLNVRNAGLDRVLFTVNRLDDVLVMQSWEENEKTRVIDGKSYKFIRVQFPQRRSGENEGWVAEAYVTSRSLCTGGRAEETAPGVGKGGWLFPTIARTTHSYKEGMRRFKAGRSGGRLHAACDLYRVKDERLVSVGDGVIIRDRHAFYQGTYSIEVKYNDGRVVRYGEITGKAAPGVSLGAKVKAGQTIGYVGKVNSGCCNPMLHFEMYSGTATGSLSQPGNQFGRRKDLLDPTADLSSWEKAQFGKSY